MGPAMRIIERGTARSLMRLHQRDGGEHRDGRLADRHDMHVSPEKPKKLNDVVDIIVEVERTRGARHEARVLPFGHIDLVVGQKVAHGAAQKRREMTGHRRDDQELRIAPAAPARDVPLEMNEIAEWLGDQRALAHGDLAAV